MDAEVIPGMEEQREPYLRLQEQIREERRLHDALSAGLAALKNRLQLVEADEEYAALIRKKTRESMLLLHRQNEEDLRALRERYRRKRLEREQEIAKADREIHIMKQQLSRLQSELEEALETCSSGYAPIRKAETDAQSEPERLKKHYIVGKRAGEDLFDQDETLLIAKGDVITMEIVDQAERSNRLTPLILHMNMPADEVKS